VIKIERSEAERDEDRLVRVTTFRGVVCVTFSDWSKALASVTSFNAATKDKMLALGLEILDY
jgi:hypothetical protein